MAMQMNFNFPDCSGTPLKELIPLASNDGITVINSLIHWCPNKRPKADQVRIADQSLMFSSFRTDAVRETSEFLKIK